jgi:glyoxylase-like metal-dependent hydrolase (beta-lactamase superfamily II)
MTKTADRLEPDRPEPGLRRIVAPNPSPLTHRGTNTWILGEGRVAVIDPGPDIPAHLAAILASLAPGEVVSHILVTHAHADHSPLARDLSAITGAPVLGFGPALAGRSAVMQRLAETGHAGGGEGLDADFAPDVTLRDGEIVSGTGWQVQAIHTPGHFAGHLAFAWGDRLFSGDLVMGWSTSLVSPPDGDMGDYMASLSRLARRNWGRFYPGHGDIITAPAARLAELAAHRRAREAAILRALSDGPLRLGPLTERVYADTPAALHPAAARNAFAHLINLAARQAVTAIPILSPDAEFAVGDPPTKSLR